MSSCCRRRRRGRYCGWSSAAAAWASRWKRARYDESLTGLRQNLDGHAALHQHVFGQIDAAHAAGAQVAQQLVLAEEEALVASVEQLVALPRGEQARPRSRIARMSVAHRQRTDRADWRSKSAKAASSWCCSIRPLRRTRSRRRARRTHAESVAHPNWTQRSALRAAG